MATIKGMFRVGPWTADPAALTLSDEDRTIHLRPKVMELLAAFAAHSGEVLSKRKILDLVWPDVTVGDASLTVAIRELRKALGDRAESPAFIETIPRRGYRMIVPVLMEGGGHSSRPFAGSRFWLIGHESRFALVEGPNVIGRAPDASVRIPSSKVSRHHARIVIDGETAAIEDLDSKNGTFLTGVRVDEPTPLSDGDEIRLGQMAVTLRVVAIGRESTVTEQSQATIVMP